MAKKKKNGLSLLAVLFTLGVIASIVGLFISWFVSEIPLLDKAEGVSLFSKDLTDLEETMAKLDAKVVSITLVKSVAIASAVFAVICFLVAIFGSVKGLKKLLLAAVTIALGAVTISLSGAYANDINEVTTIASFSITKLSLGAGVFVNAIGAIVSGATYLIKK